MDKFEQVYLNIIEQNWKGALVGSLLATGWLAADGADNTTRPLNKNTQKNKIQATTPSKSFKDQQKDATINLAVGFLKKMEGCKKDKDGNLIVYRDSAGVETIGYGETDPIIVSKGKLTEKEATNYLKKKVVKFYDVVQKKISPDAFNKLNIRQKMVLISFYYNLGPNFNAPKLVKAIQQGDYQTAAKQFLDCDNIKQNGKLKKVKGLTQRRKLESKIFNPPQKVNK